jgi:hypothetical protein
MYGFVAEVFHYLGVQDVKVNGNLFSVFMVSAGFSSLR